MTTAPKYTRAEPPALLTEPLAVTLDALDLDDLNEFRQAEHALHYPPAGMFGRQPDEHRQLQIERARTAALSLARSLSEWADAQRRAGLADAE